MNKIYKIKRRRYLYKLIGLCSFCGWHSGCNSAYRLKEKRNWKEYRKTQYK